jgi:hypothetical protein
MLAKAERRYAPVPCVRLRLLMPVCVHRKAIFVHDDGLQVISEAERIARIMFYTENDIGWVARPPHDNVEGGFKRHGRFKKASNMNYGLALSLKMEAHIARLKAELGEKGSVNLDEHDNDFEERALQLAIEEAFEDGGRKGKAWACNARALRVGQVILIVDADTLVPEVGRYIYSEASSDSRRIASVTQRVN